VINGIVLTSTWALAYKPLEAIAYSRRRVLVRRRLSDVINNHHPHRPRSVLHSHAKLLL
jgi:hypothetical protein